MDRMWPIERSGLTPRVGASALRGQDPVFVWAHRDIWEGFQYGLANVASGFGTYRELPRRGVS